MGITDGIGAARISDAIQQVAHRIRPRSIVTLHHLACSGGTIITKALGAMSGSIVLSEIHPDRAAQPAFHPLSQLRGGYGELLSEAHGKAIRAHFRNEIGIAHAIAKSSGRTLIVRDHAHADFVWAGRKNSLLLDQLKSHFSVTPIVTVRDPREVWLSVKREGWFEGTIDELCQAHCNLLDAFPDAPVIRYEDFAAQPAKTVERMCRIVGIGFEPDFQSRLDNVRHLTGDSGRKSSVIEPRPPKPLPDADQAAFENSDAFAEFSRRMGYGSW